MFQDYRLKDGIGNEGIIHFLFGRSPNFMGLLSFIVIINLGVGMFNLLPIGPLDGGRMWKIVMDKLLPRYSKRVLDTVSWVFFIIIIILFVNAAI